MITNTQEFRKAALDFQKQGYYIDAPAGSQDFYEFWTEELRRCREGYKVGDTWITGNHYFYLNYVQMKVMDDNKKGGAAKKVDFPGFWDGDYEFFHLMEIARNGSTAEEVAKLGLSTDVHPDWLDGGHHLIVAKA